MINYRLILLVLALVVTDYAFAEYPVSISTGFDYSQGDYGLNQSTKMTAMPLSIALKNGQWTLKSSFSHIKWTGPGTVDIDSGISSGATSTAKVSESGIGDTTVSVKYAFQYANEQGIFLDLSSLIKVPTGDEDKQLSSGEYDYTILLDIAKSLNFQDSRSLFPYASIGYRITGDSDSYQPKNVWLLTMGGQFQYDRELAFGAQYDYRQAYTESSDPLQELMLYSSYHFSKKYQLTLYGMKGFSDNSLDYGLGTVLTIRF